MQRQRGHLVNCLHAKGVRPWLAQLAALFKYVREGPVGVEHQVVDAVEVWDLSTVRPVLYRIGVRARETGLHTWRVTKAAAYAPSRPLKLVPP